MVSATRAADWMDTIIIVSIFYFIVFVVPGVESHVLEPEEVQTYDTTLLKITDGDTFKARVFLGVTYNKTCDFISSWPGLFCDAGLLYWRGSIRIAGIDTPESRRSQCPSEKVRGKQAGSRLAELLQEAPIQVRNVIEGKWAGRLVAEVILANGKSVADVLIAEGHAVPYSGGKRQSWCE